MNKWILFIIPGNCIVSAEYLYTEEEIKNIFKKLTLNMADLYIYK